MRAANVYTRFDWPYDDALLWMEESRARVLEGGPMCIGVGSHREEVVTLGRNAPEDQLLARDALLRRGALLRRVERGGGATAHGPGQVVVYPVVSLPALGLDVPALTCAFERSVIRLLADRGIVANADRVDRGVYVDGAKVASLGFRVTKGVVTHGLALNVDNDLSLFSLIAPCGHVGQPMTSLAALCPHGSVDVAEISSCLISHLAEECVLELRL